MPPTPPSMMAGHVEAEPAKKFPTLAVVILSLGMIIHSYTLVSLFPYVGMMVKDLLSLETTNEAGECNRVWVHRLEHNADMR